MQNQIIIKGAKEHNLKNVDLELPKNKLIVFTGVSGSGKSSLAFDTIFAEGQRRYVESLSAYARQFLGQKDKPDVESIEGLSPAIAIDQKASNHNPRSTVATITEIYDYLRVLFARIGIPYCPNDGTKIEKMSVDEIVNYTQPFLTSDVRNGVLSILAPVVEGRKGEYHQLLYDLYLEGYQKAYIDNKPHNLADRVTLSRYKQHKIEVVVDENVPTVEEGGAVEAIRYLDHEIWVAGRADTECTLWLSELFYPGWKATINGRSEPIYRANGIFRALKLEKGHFDVRFRYEPSSFYWGLVVSGFSFLLIVFFYLIGDNILLKK